MELKYAFSVGIVCKLVCGRVTKERKTLIFIENLLTLFIIFSGLQSMAVEMIVERQPSSEKEHTFRFVPIKIIFLGPKHHLGKVLYSKESCSKLPYVAAIQIT